MSTQTTETLNRQVIELVSSQIDIPKEQISLDSQFIAEKRGPISLRKTKLGPAKYHEDPFCHKRFSW